MGLSIYGFSQFLIPPSLSSFLLRTHSLSLSPLNATDVFLSRSNRQESTGKKKGSVFPRREEHKAPCLHTADAESHLPPARCATSVWEISHKVSSFSYLYLHTHAVWYNKCNNFDRAPNVGQRPLELPALSGALAWFNRLWVAHYLYWSILQPYDIIIKRPTQTKRRSIFISVNCLGSEAERVNTKQSWQSERDRGSWSERQKEQEGDDKSAKASKGGRKGSTERGDGG